MSFSLSFSAPPTHRHIHPLPFVCRAQLIAFHHSAKPSAPSLRLAAFYFLLRPRVHHKCVRIRFVIVFSVVSAPVLCVLGAFYPRSHRPENDATDRRLCAQLPISAHAHTHARIMCIWGAQTRRVQPQSFRPSKAGRRRAASNERHAVAARMPPQSVRFGTNTAIP